MQSVEGKMSAYIRSRGMRINYVSKISGVPYHLLQPALNGKRKMQIDEFLNVCQALGVSPETFKPDDMTA